MRARRRSLRLPRRGRSWVPPLGVAAGFVAGLLAGWALERRWTRRFLPRDGEDQHLLRGPLPGAPVTVTSGDGTRLHARVCGPEDAPTIVLAHGYGMSLRAWAYQCRDLADSYRVVAYDQRGHGRSSPAATDDYSLAALGQDLAAVLDAVVPSGQQAVVAGHSMGGMTILAYADAYPAQVPERLAGAAFVDSAGDDVVANAFYETRRDRVLAFESKVAGALWRFLERAGERVDRVYGASSDLSYLAVRAIALQRDADPAHVALTEQLWLDCPTPVEAALGPAVSSINLRTVADAVQIPAVVVAGDRDRLTPPAQSHKLVEALPDAELVVLEGVGHMAPMEAHEQVSATLRAFAGRVLADADAGEAAGAAAEAADAADGDAGAATGGG